ncbi:hypothetical protein OHB54_29695 [Streptomyces sp. NBC_01007]|nr:hypothetical protein OHB54_29695 [Streptomyces sp. NBC_01007]
MTTDELAQVTGHSVDAACRQEAFEDPTGRTAAGSRELNSVAA